jgi:hypothetical protein
VEGSGPPHRQNRFCHRKNRGGLGGKRLPRRARRARTDCKQASAGLGRCCAWFLAGGGPRAWRNVHRRRDPGRAVPGEHPERACCGCFSPERGKRCSTGCPLEQACVGACSVQFLGLGAVPARCSEQNTRWNHNSWQQSTTVEKCSDGCRRRSAFTRCMNMKWARMMPTIASFWCLRGGNRPGTAHSGAGAAQTII